MIVSSPDLGVDDASFEQRVTTLASELQASPYVLATRTVYDTESPALVAPNGKATLITLALAPGGEDGIPEIVDIVDAAEAAGFLVSADGLPPA